MLPDSSSARAISRVFLLWLACFAIVTPLFLPQVWQLPARDSGTFLEIAQRVLDGGIPYRDAWDHKGPAIYYIDALALAISAGRFWGLWALELGSLALASVLGFETLRRGYGTRAALFGSGLWLLSAIPVLQGGNLVEQWALPLQFGALYLFVGVGSKPGRGVWATLLIGALGAVVFLLRANLIGVWVAIWIEWMLIDWRRGLERTAYLALAASLVLALTAAYFAAHGAFADLWDAVITYNRAYSATDAHWTRKLGTIIAGAGFIVSWPVICAGWALATHALFAGKSPRDPLLRLAVMLLPIEMVLTAVSGREYPHYYLSWLPEVALLGGFFGFWLSSHSSRAPLGVSRDLPRATEDNVVMAALLVSACVLVYPIWRYQATLDHQGRSTPTFLAVRWIKAHTAPSDTILVWGAESAVYEMSDRLPASRFFYQYPLVTPGYASDALGREFLSALLERRPRIIIDAGDSKLPRLNATERDLAPHARPNWRAEDDGNYVMLRPSMRALFTILDRDYVRADDISTWQVYVLRDDRR